MWRFVIVSTFSIEKKTILTENKIKKTEIFQKSKPSLVT